MEPTGVTLAEVLEQEAFVRGVARAALGADGDDVAQETLWAAAQARPQVRSLRAWLATVVRRRAASAVRSAARRRHHEARASHAEATPDVADVVAREDVRRTLVREVLALDPADRDLLLLRYYEDLAPHEIGARLGIPPETARTRVRRAIERLRGRLSAKYGGREAWAPAIAPWALLPAPAPVASGPWPAGVTGTVLLLTALVAVGVVAFRGGGPGRDAPGDVAAPATEAAASVGEPLAASGPAAAGAARRDGSAAVRGRASIEGLVRVNGRPVAATVEVARLGDAGTSDTTSDVRRVGVTAPQVERCVPVRDDGAFRVDGLAAGRYALAASAPGALRGLATVELAVDGSRSRAVIELVPASATLAGRVRHPDGRPAVCDVRVRGAGRLPTPDAVTVTDADGGFRVDGLPAGLVTVVASDARVQSTSFAIPVPAARDVELVLGATDGVLAGQVVDERDRRPVAGATVFASADGGLRASRLDQVVVTDLQGRFELQVAAPGTTRIEVEADGFARAPFTVDPAPVLPLVVPIAREARLEGRITRADTAVALAGATVRVVASGMRRGPRPPLVATTTDGDGRYAFRGLVAGEVTVLAFAPGLASAEAARIDARGFNPLAVTLVPGETTSFDVELAPAATLSGHVRDERGHAVEGAVVEVAIAAGMGREAALGGSTATATGADGAFRLEAVPAGLLLRVVARAPGRATGAWGPVRAAAGDGPTIDLVLPEVRRVDVEVRDARSGAAVAGARVRATAGRRGAPADARAAVVTGADGRAVAVEVAPDGEDLEVTAPGYVPVTSLDVEPDATVVSVALRPGRPLRGRVLGPAGEPAAGASLFVRWDERSASLAGFHAADAAGEFTIDDVPPGSYHVSAELAAGPRRMVASGRVEAGGPFATLRLAEVVGSADVRTVTVRVRAPDGRAVARAAVQLDLGETRVTTWADGGAAVFGGMPVGVAGTVRVTNPTDASGVALPFAPAVVEVGPDRAEVNVTLPVGRVLRGRVVDPDGRGVRGAQVLAAAVEPGADDDDPGEPADVARSAADGSFELRALADAEHLVWVDGPADTLPPDAVRASPGTRELRFVLEPGVGCEVKVLDGEGRPVVGASVRVTPVVGDDAVTARAMRTSRRPAVAVDTAGVARLAGLEPGRAYVRRVEARAAGFLAAEDEAWTPRDEVVVLRPARRVTGLVTDLAGVPVPRAAIAWRIVGSGWTLSRAGLDGAFALEDLPDGDLEVGAGRANAMAAEGETQRVRAGATGLRFRIDAGQTVRVKVLDWPETLAQGITARLLVLGAGEPQLRVRTVEVDGTVEFRGVTAGRRALYVAPLPDGRCAYVADLGDDLDVTVRLVPGRTTTGLVVLPAGARSPEVYAEGPPGCAASAEVGADGRFTLRGLVEGLWTLHARVRVGDAIWAASTTVPAGDEAKLEPAPR